ncbi:MAG: hypothetical protein ACK4S3_08935 [Parvibaculum sp.]
MDLAIPGARVDKFWKGQGVSRILTLRRAAAQKGDRSSATLDKSAPRQHSPTAFGCRKIEKRAGEDPSGGIF